MDRDSHARVDSAGEPSVRKRGATCTSRRTSRQVWRPRRRAVRGQACPDGQEDRTRGATPREDEQELPECEWAVLEDPWNLRSRTSLRQRAPTLTSLRRTSKPQEGDAPRRSRQQQGCEQAADSFVSLPSAPHSLRQVPAQCLGSHFASKAPWHQFPTTLRNCAPETLIT